MEAANTNRKLAENVKANRMWSEKLSSGYRVNRAADDAAGLAISEEMRAQIRGLNRGSVNCTEGVSMLQTADAALVEVHSMLDRIKELTVQSANDVNTAEDRRAIQNEVNALLDEIDHIGNDTEYNTIKIFTGSEAGIIGPDGNPTTLDRIPYSAFNLSNITLGDRPISGTSPSELSFVASLDPSYTTVTGIPARWPLIYRNGNSSLPNFRVSYTNDTGVTVSEHLDLPHMTVSNYNYDATNQSYSRVYHYSCPSDANVSFDITQEITVNSPAGSNDYKYYGINYTVKNTGTKNGTVDFMFHADTAYGGDHAGDGKEGYYINGNKVTRTCLYSNQYLGSSNPNIINGVNFTNFSINNVNLKKSLPFSEQIRFSGDAPDTVAIGKFSTICQWANYDNIGTSNNLELGISTGTDTSSIDLGFSLIWANKPVAAGNSQNFSFQYGIISALQDNNVPQDQLQISNSGNIHTDTLNLWIQSGANSLDGMYVTIGAMNSNVLNIRPLDVTTQLGAGNSNALTDKAIEQISLQRAGIGAYHNRLEHAQSGDDNTSENLQAAESIIRDLDMADGMVNYARTNILMQAGQSMLAQANQQTQGILSLLR